MAFNKYDNDSSLALGGRHHMDSSEPIIDQDDDDDDFNFFGVNRKERSRAKQVDPDSSKVSAFSRRTKSKYKDGSGDGKSGKKGRGGRSKSSNKTPPDSPKTKLELTPRGKSVRGGQPQPSPSGKGKSNYASLLDFSSDEGETVVDEEDADNFLLSKGHLAREKRSGTATKKDFNPAGVGAEGDVIALNPMVLEETHTTGSDKSAFTSSYPPTVSLSTVQAFPVQFAPPTEAKFPEPQALPNLQPEPFSYTKPPPAAAVISPPLAQPVAIPSLPPPPSSSVPPPLLTQPLPAPPPSVTTFPLPSAAPINPPSSTSASSQPHLPSTSLAFPSPPSTTDASQTTASQSAASLSPVDWSLSEDFRQRCTSQFNDLKPDNGLLKGETARNFFVQSRLSMDELSKIWKLADGDQDGALTLHEFCVAMKLVLVRRKGDEIPSSLPESLVQRRKKQDSRHPINPRMRFSIPPPPPSSAPNSHTSITDPNSKNIPPIDETSESPTKKSLVNQKSAPNLLEPSASSSEKDFFSITQDLSKKKSKKEDDERELMSESFTEPVGTDEDDGVVKKERTRYESLGFGFDPSLEFRSKAMTMGPAVARLISFGDAGDTDDGSADDTAVLVEEKKMRRRSSSLSEQAPKPKPRRKKRNSPKVDRSSTSTEDTPTRKAAPPPPAPYTRRSTSPLPRSTSADSFQTQDTTLFINKDPTSPNRSDSSGGTNYQSKPVRPPRANEVSSYSRHLDEDDNKSGGEDLSKEKNQAVSRQRTLSPDSADDKFVKGHARNPSWGMILKDEKNPMTDDLPSAEPPKLPPRTSKHNLSANIVDETSPPPGQLSRSASTGSLASIGRGTSISVKARSPPVDSDSLLTSMELVTETSLPKRPAPAPPTRPKPPRKVPMYPPSFKRVEAGDSPEDSDLVMSVEERSSLVESYKKKTKVELQRSIKSLKDDNAMFTNLNQDLRRILTGLREQQARLEVLMDHQR